MKYELFRESECKFMKAPSNIEDIDIFKDLLEKYLFEINKSHENKDYRNYLMIIDELVSCADLYSNDDEYNLMKRSYLLRLKRDIYINQKEYNRMTEIHKELYKPYSKIGLSIISIDERNRASEIIDEKFNNYSNVQILSDENYIYIYFFPFELYMELSIKVLK